MTTVRAVVFDLDDTLYPQEAFLQGALDRVAEHAARVHGLAPESFRRALQHSVEQGSGRGGVIDTALATVGADSIPVADLVDVFRSYVPVALEPYPGVRSALSSLAADLPLAVLTDGVSSQQRAKLAATGLADLFSVVVVTDDYGREHRKPASMGFRRVLDALGVDPWDAVMIGDRPDKDVSGAIAVGMHAIRVRQGEHRDMYCDALVAAEVDSTPEAVDVVNDTRSVLR